MPNNDFVSLKLRGFPREKFLSVFLRCISLAGTRLKAQIIYNLMHKKQDTNYTLISDPKLFHFKKKLIKVQNWTVLSYAHVSHTHFIKHSWTLWKKAKLIISILFKICRQFVSIYKYIHSIEEYLKIVFITNKQSKYSNNKW